MASFGILALVWFLDARMRRNRRTAIDAQLSDTPCPECRGGLKPWCGSMSGNHYQFIAGANVECVIDVECGNCGKHMDAFWHCGSP
jgi:hypothetical protein